MNYYRANYHADDYAWRGGRCAVERAWLAPLLPRLAQLDVERLMLGRLPDRHVDAGGAPAAEATADEGGGGSGGGDVTPLYQNLGENGAPTADAGGGEHCSAPLLER